MDMKITLIATSILLCILGASISSAEMYKWVDEKGVVHFQDSPQDASSSTSIETRKDEPKPTPKPSTQPTAPKPAPTTAEPPKAVAPEPKPAPKVTTPPPQSQETTLADSSSVQIYTTSWCGYCKKAKEYLESKGIAYTEFDVEKDPEALRRKNEMVPNSGVPVMVWNNTAYKGFSKKMYDQIFKSQSE